ncbi:O-antigen ligase family protein [Aurantiacibacter sp. MUD11]|uniref:O-antigen ligase family protein n=1 Tax=Aurantiacibacter sp. MUD11 TaxID=3003265 RepID=UPI0022AAA0E1|nr:O-antigen ligase family protein [Aurantiacibacter sp. MUD11]WAT17569.1 O-antigen ligase family protein [Aurantiacibacter sp. MUD11]
MRLTRLVDYALWLLLLLSLMRTTVLIRRRDTSEFNAIDSSATFAVLIVATILGLLVVHPRARGTLMKLQSSSAILLLVYLAVAAFSAFWSQEPLYTLFRAGEVLAVFGALYVLMDGYSNWRDAERAMLWTLMIVTVLSLMQRVMTGGISVQGLHTNVYTVTAGMGFLYALGESLRADPLRKAALRRWAGVFVIFAILGTSAGSNIAIALGMLVLLPFLSRSKVIVIPAAVACLALVVVMGTSEQLLSTTVLTGRSVDEVSHLTGRFFLWQGYWNAFIEQPLIGQGFAIVARIGDQFGTLATTNAHNGYIEALAGLGIIGFALLVYHSIRLTIETVAASRARIAGGLGSLAAVVMLLVNNNSKSILGGAFDPTVVGALAVLAFLHTFTLRATREQADIQRRGTPMAPQATGEPTPARQ